MEKKRFVEFSNGTSSKVREDWCEVIKKVDKHFWAIWSVCVTDDERELLTNTMGKLLVDLREQYVQKAMIDTLRNKLN